MPEGDGDKLWAYTTVGAALVEIEFTTPRRGNQKARSVHQHLWGRSVEITDGQRERITAICIIAREVGAPTGVKPIELHLLTTRPGVTLEQVVGLIEWYRARWEIELDFHVLRMDMKSKRYNCRASIV